MPFESDQQRRFVELLNSGVQQMALEISDAKIDQLINYLFLLDKWNKAFNLTAVRRPEDMLARHLLDSLSIVPHVTGHEILDVGTGPGLPGIPLAICFPEKKFVLLDSNSKKTRFLTQAKIDLGLKNVDIRHQRIEQLNDFEGFDQIFSRAFASLEKMTKLCQPYLRPEGKFMAMKGPDVVNEETELDKRFEIIERIKLDIPSCEAERHLIIIRDTST